LLAGPTAADRAVALDVLTLIFMPAMVGVAVLADRSIYLDVALVYGLLSFLGVMSLARYIDRGL
jgi:multicomponent Na+:H+ antiporter subunit F